MNSMNSTNFQAAQTNEPPPYFGVNVFKFYEHLKPLNLMKMFGTQLIKRSLFNLSDDFIFMNHGAFGAAFKPSIECANEWKYYGEKRPAEFIDRELPELLKYTSRFFAQNLFNCESDELALIDNVSFGFSSILNSIKLDEKHYILVFNTTYNTFRKILDRECKRRRSKIVCLEIQFPIKSEEDLAHKIVNKFYEKCLTDMRIKYFIIDLVPSAYPFLMPVKILVDLCKSKRPDIICIVDAAHALGSVRNFHFGTNGVLNRNIDLMITNCHKWFCAPKGTGFIFKNKSLDTDHPSRSLINLKPAVQSKDAGFIEEFNWIGLKDYTNFLSLFTTYYIWHEVLGGIDHVLDYTHGLAHNVARYLRDKWQTELMVANEYLCTSLISIRLPEKFVRMALLEYFYIKTKGNIPTDTVVALQDLRFPVKYGLKVESIVQKVLNDLYRIVAQVKVVKIESFDESNKVFIRISAHIYNYWEEYLYLGECVKHYAQYFPYNSPKLNQVPWPVPSKKNNWSNLERLHTSNKNFQQHQQFNSIVIYPNSKSNPYYTALKCPNSMNFISSTTICSCPGNNHVYRSY